jgi:hypothetical protein
LPALTDEQLRLIEQKRRKTLPSYYDSVMDQRRQISEDTEAALILLTSTTKDATSKYLKTFLNRDDRSEDYTDLLTEMLDKQIANAEAAVAEMDAMFDGYDALKSSLMGDGNEIFIVGVEPLLKSFGVALGRLKRQRDAIVYNELHLDSSRFVVTSKLTEPQKKELRSWIPVLLAYP